MLRCCAAAQISSLPRAVLLRGYRHACGSERFEFGIRADDAFKQTAAGWRLGRVSFKLQYWSLDSIPRTLARGHRRPCRNSQFQADPAHGVSTSSRKSRNNFRGPPRRPARGSLPRRRPPRFGRSSEARVRLVPEARLRGPQVQSRRGTRFHRRNQDTPRRNQDTPPRFGPSSGRGHFGGRIRVSRIIHAGMQAAAIQASYFSC